jgi:hypothetical protein
MRKVYSMDSSQFDALAKSLAQRRSRRATLKGLGKAVALTLGIGGPIAAIT